jgi:folate-binding protein YgfZ
MDGSIDPGFLDVTRWRAVAVTGDDALGWLDALVTADLRGIAPGEARRSLLLSPTGGVLASFTVLATEDGVLLLQDPGEPRSIGDLLGRYVLSADVRVYDGGGPVGPGPDDRWRIEAGAPRVGTDVADGDLPAEADLDDLVSHDKGCFLGQEAVAKVRTLGHPRRLLLRLRSDASVDPGEPVLLDDVEVGAVTSAAASGPGSIVFARIRWEARAGALRTAAGARLDPV